ncbi:hypothetical protein [Parahaliea mediterranea]|uniref:DUF3718 domain-containing protein n=1 Tax=Parahaliea mediterranea TaxID=651086 RepID=A0A939IJ55_9GAMM|nr:hypothetical protein [Parahaliea mediterranea]MBN7795916.1 hypothetical protein [Parahaliea mediterranea]
MNKLASITIGLAVAATSLNAAADRNDRAHLAMCNDNIRQALGEDTHTRLYGIQHRRDGDRLRLKALPAEGDSQVLNCWVDEQGGVTLQTKDGVALRTPAYDGGERVSLSE